MEWIVEAESLSDFVDHGRYTLSTKPLIRCKDCREFRRWIDTDITFCDLTESERDALDFCSRAEREEDDSNY